MTDPLAIRAEASRIALALEKQEKHAHFDGEPEDHFEEAIERCIAQGWEVHIGPGHMLVRVEDLDAATYGDVPNGSLSERLARTLRYLCTLTTGLGRA